MKGNNKNNIEGGGEQEMKNVDKYPLLSCLNKSVRKYLR